MPWYRVRLRLIASPTDGQLDDLERAGIDVWRRADALSVTLTTNGGDPAGALARAQNEVLDRLPGDIEHAEVTVTDAPERAARRRRR